MTIDQHLAFFREMEKLKTVCRQNRTLDGRFENSAEHSWQLALMALSFKSYFPEPLDMEKVLTMLLIHELGEIGAGDTSVFDDKGKAEAYAKELASVKESLALLPEAEGEVYLTLWKEFEGKGQSPEARYARCIDALAPLMSHLWVAEKDDNPEGLTKSQVLEKKSFIQDESPVLWDLAQDLLSQSVAKGLYLDK